MQISSNSSSLLRKADLIGNRRDRSDEFRPLVGPELGDSIQVLARLHSIRSSVELGVDEIDGVVGGRLMLRGYVPNLGEILIEGADWTVVHDSSTGEKEEVVEEAEGVVIGLMNRADYDCCSSSREELHCACSISE